MFTRPHFQTRFVALASVLLFAAACGKQQEEEPKASNSPGIPKLPEVQLDPVQFDLAPGNLGIEMVHTSGADGRKYLPETMGGGVCLFDYDGDGDLDVYFTNGRAWGETSEPTLGRLYAWEQGRFVDRTEAAGLLDEAFQVVGQGASAADYDGDGDLDLYVTCLGPNLLFRNEANRFVEVAGEAGVRGATWSDGEGREHPEWSTSSGFCDLDGDDALDLFVCNYLQWSTENDVDFTLTGDVKGYASPKLYRGSTCRLFRNLGNGRFEDVTESSGILNADHKALGVCFADVNGDDRVDILVANDTQPNCLFLNEGGMRFQDVAVQAGVGYGVDGRVRAGMGIDAGYYAEPGQLAIAIGNFTQEPISFYRSRGAQRLVFSDDNVITGLGRSSGPSLTFSTAFLDANLDGFLDLLAINGHLDPDIELVSASTSYRQRPQLFVNTGVRGKFSDQSATAGSAFQLKRVGRGLALGDLDQDGDLDAIVTECGGPAQVWINQNPTGRKSLRIRLLGAGGNTQAIGAKVTVSGGPYTQTALVRTGQAYLSQHETTLTFGLGDRQQADVQVTWPDGAKTEHQGLKLGQLHQLQQP